MAKLSEKSQVVFDYLVTNDGTDMTATDIADALGLEVKSVNGIITRGLGERKNKEGEVTMPALAKRVETAIKTDEGSKTVKFIVLTDEGKSFESDAE